MKFAITTMLAVLLGVAPLAAQPVQQTGAGTPTPTVRSPEVLADGRVTFRLYAPDAQSVAVRGNMPTGYTAQVLPLTKGADGVWSGTSAALAPEIRFYTFVVDGVVALDPRNPHVRRDGLNYASTVIVPGAGSELARVADIPHGTVTLAWYRSPALGLTRRVTVYTPAGYETSRARYPVLYLLHGAGGDEQAWDDNGRASEILDALIASGKARPMIVVMPNGNARQSASQNYVDDTPPTTTNGSMAFPDSIASDLIPFIDTNFRTQTGAASRAIAGLSMGGGQTIWTAFHHLDRFAWVASFSGAYMLIPGVGVAAPPPPNAATLRQPGVGQTIDPAKMAAALPALDDANKRLKLLYMSVGAHDGLVTAQNAFAALLDQKGIRYTASIVPGYQHEWPFWRVALADLAPRLFQPAR